MLEQEEFKRIAEIVTSGNDLSKKDANSMLVTLLELDAHLVVLQNAIELTIVNAQDVLPALAEKILQMSGRTDAKSKKKVATMAAEITARFIMATELYVQGALEEANSMITKIGNGELNLNDILNAQEIEQPTTEEETTNE